MCLDAASPQGPVKIVRCHGMGGNQAWVYDEDVSKRPEMTRNFLLRFNDHPGFIFTINLQILKIC